MKKIIEYKLLYFITLESVEEEVNHWIREGFEPLGSLSVVRYDHKIDDYNKPKRVGEYFQVMVKYQLS